MFIHNSNRFHLLLSLLVLIIYQSTCERVEQKIYVNLQSDHYCVRRLNLTNQIGCTSNAGGNIGVLWVINDESDLQHILKDGPTPPYIAIMRIRHFTSENIRQFKESYPDRISGVIVLKQNMTESGYDDTPSFSTDSTCPNRNTGLYVNDSDYGDCKKQPWQKRSDVTDLFFQEIPFPIFLMTKKESIDEIMNCYITHNQGKTSKQSDFPLCSAQLDSFMSAARNSEYCLYSRATIDDIFQQPNSRCKPINKNNIFGHYKESVGVKPLDGIPLAANRSVVLISARMDSMSFFSHLSPGADSAITGLTVLLAVAHTLSKFKKSNVTARSVERNIAFAVFDSESFDYTGSGRMAYDMKHDRLLRYYKSNAGKQAIKSVNLNGLDFIIELSQLAPYPNKSTTYIHTDPKNYDISRIKLDLAMKALKDEGVKVKGDRSPLPPSSIQSFLKLDPEIAALLVTNHEKEYNNLFYHSIFDDSSNINKTINLVDHLTSVATIVARGAFELAFGNHTEKIDADPEIVKKILECYLISSECDLISEATEISRGSIFKGPVDTYDSSVNSIITQLLLSYFLSDPVPDTNEKKCAEMSSQSLTHRYIFIYGDSSKSKEGRCIKFQVVRTPSLSPAFQYEEVEMNETLIREYSTWTESDTNIRNPVRLFFRPSPTQEYVTLFAGLALTIFSFVIVSFVHELILKHLQTSSA